MMSNQVLNKDIKDAVIHEIFYDPKNRMLISIEGNTPTHQTYKETNTIQNFQFIPCHCWVKKTFKVLFY